MSAYVFRFNAEGNLKCNSFKEKKNLELTLKELAASSKQEKQQSLPTHPYRNNIHEAQEFCDVYQ